MDRREYTLVLNRYRIAIARAIDSLSNLACSQNR